MPDAFEPFKSGLRKKAGKYFPERLLMFDLIPVIYDDHGWHVYAVEPGREVLDHATLGPTALGSGGASQGVFDDLLAQLVR